MRTLLFLISGLALCAGNSVSRAHQAVHQDGNGKALERGQLQADWIVAHDARENAFLIEVPKGWKGRSGAYL